MGNKNTPVKLFATAAFALGAALVTARIKLGEKAAPKTENNGKPDEN